jgi:hypothetical protein
MTTLEAPENSVPVWKTSEKILTALTGVFFLAGFAHPSLFVLAAITDASVLGKRMDDYNQKFHIYR